jgi:hypothetical protein
MADQPSPRRRFQFRLRTLFVWVSLVALACWATKIWRDHVLAELAERYALRILNRKGLNHQSRYYFAQSFDKHHTYVSWKSGPPISDEELAEIQIAFPGAYVVQNDRTVLQGQPWP